MLLRHENLPAQMLLFLFSGLRLSILGIILAVMFLGSGSFCRFTVRTCVNRFIRHLGFLLLEVRMPNAFGLCFQLLMKTAEWRLCTAAIRTSGVPSICCCAVGGTLSWRRRTCDFCGDTIQNFSLARHVTFG